MERGRVSAGRKTRTQQKAHNLPRLPPSPASFLFSIYLEVVLESVGLEEADDGLGVVVVLVGRRLLGLRLWEGGSEEGERRSKGGGE